jgi:hypothetical protein
MRIRLVTMLIAVAAGCSSDRQNPTSIIPPVPAIGDPVRTTDAKPEPNTMVMAASSQMWPRYNLTVDGVHFVLGVDRDGAIRYICTEQTDFKTPEGVCVGDSYQSVISRAGKRAVAESGWAYHVGLPSGWRAAFVQGGEMTEGELAQGARVRWLFKR